MSLLYFIFIVMHNFLELSLINISLVLAIILGIVFFIVFNRRQVKKQQEHFLQELEKFNQNRHNPLTAQEYKTIYDYENMLFINPFSGTFSSMDIKDSNHRDGDELILNKNRSTSNRIDDHLGLNKLKNKDQLVISSLGYDFKNADNIIDFCTTFLTTLKQPAIFVFPINNTWFICGKTKDNNYLLSFDKTLLTK